MKLFGFNKFQLETERLTLRPPIHSDYLPWSNLRSDSHGFLSPWEPSWSKDHLSRKSFSNRIRWAQRSIDKGTALPLMIVRREDSQLVGGITLENIRRGPAQAATLGYWTGQPFARQGYMREAILSVVHHAFVRLDLSRIEAGCLPHNVASRGVLEKCGFKYEGVAQSYLQINGRWSDHVLFAALRSDRRGRTTVG